MLDPSVEALRDAVGSLEPRTFRGGDAARLLQLFAEVERLGAAGKAMMARRVEETNARAAGRRESSEAYAADGFVAMTDAAVAPGTIGTETSGPRAMVHVRVDHAALVRGHTAGDEVCEVPGVGPVSVATARAWAGDAVLKALVTRGTDVVAVAHAGRSVTAAQRSALEERDRCCVVESCGVTKGLEIDHVDGWALTRITTVERLARLCRWHHYLKTHCGYRLEGRAGRWQLVPPDHPPDDASRSEPPEPGSLDLDLACVISRPG